ncbi:MAG: TolC family protein [Chitinophagales bacterium]|nr:TolC family protein [Chitinophagales bacterium]
MKVRTLIFGLLVSFESWAQGSAIQWFGLQEAVRYALEHQPVHRNAELGVAISRRSVQEVIGIGLPQVTAKADFTHYLELPTSLIPGEFFGGEPGTYIPVQFGTSYNTGAGLTLTQLLFDGRYLLGVKAAQIVQELASKEAQRSRIAVIEQVSKAYLTALMAEQRQMQVASNLKSLNELLKNTEALYAAGFVEQLDVDRLRVSYNNLLAEQEKVSFFVQSSKDLLKFQMGLPVQAEIGLTDSLPSVEAVSLIPALATDPNQRIEYRMLQDQLRLAEMNVKRYRAGYWPSLYGAASLQVQSQENRLKDIPSGTWYDMSLVGLSLNVPIFDGLSKVRQIQGAKLELLRAQNNMELFENSMNLEVRTARGNLENALRSLKVNEENLELADKVMRSSRIKFEQQVGSSLEVTEAEASLKNAQIAYLTSLYEVWLAKLELEKALGTLDKNF